MAGDDEFGGGGARFLARYRRRRRRLEAAWLDSFGWEQEDSEAELRGLSDKQGGTELAALVGGHGGQAWVLRACAREREQTREKEREKGSSVVASRSLSRESCRLGGGE
jgi:hypothetical protein